MCEWLNGTAAIGGVQGILRIPSWILTCEPLRHLRRRAVFILSAELPFAVCSVLG